MNAPDRGLGFWLPASISLAVILVAGCATPTVLPREAREQVNRTDVRSYIPQEEINVQYMLSTYGSGLGLVGVIVDASVNAAMASSAEARANQIRQQVKELDFRNDYWRALSNAVADVSWLHLRRFSAVPSGIVGIGKNDIVEAAAMNIGTDYFISPNGRVFEITTGIGFVVPGKAKIAAANSMTYYSAQIGDVEGDDAMNAWMENGGVPVRQAASEGIEESGKLMRYALSLMGGETNATMRPAKVKARLVHGRAAFGIPVARITMKGYVLEENPDRIIFQAAHGPLYSFPRKEVEIEFAKVK